MASSSSYSVLLRLIRPKGIFGSSSNHCSLGKWSARSGASLFNRRALCTATNSSPLLMLPPELEAGTTSYKFYNLADNKVQTLCPCDEIRDLRLTCSGSSHGWLALLRPHHSACYLYNPITGRCIIVPSIFNLPTLFKDSFFLYNPISCRLIKLPSILNLATFFKDDVLAYSNHVTKVIISCSPDEDEENCRAVIVRDSGNALAFCCPGRSKEWTFMLDEERGDTLYRDCVYSTRQNLFFALISNYPDMRIETWDLGDPSSPKLIKVDETNINQGHSYSLFHTFVPFSCETKERLVVAKEDLLLVIQYIMYHVGSDGSCFDDDDYDCPDNCRHMTIGFDIFKYDSEKGKFKYLDSSSLGDLAIFVGSHSHSVAIQATEFPGVKPNSIYFTDAYGTRNYFQGVELYHDYPICGYDIGIYNYEHKTVSPCYYPCDASSVKTIMPAPIWFFPSRTI